jgi:hypothetical protein
VCFALFFSLFHVSPLPRRRELDAPDALIRFAFGAEQFINAGSGREFAQAPQSHYPRMFTHEVLAHRPMAAV